MTQLTIADKLRNLNHDTEGCGLQSESDLHSNRNSCDVSFLNIILREVVKKWIFYGQADRKG